MSPSDSSIPDYIKEAGKASKNVAVGAGSGVIRQLNDLGLKKIQLVKIAKALGSSQFLLLGGTAALGLWLASRAKNSKRQDQMEY